MIDFLEIIKAHSYELDSAFLYIFDKGCKNVDIRMDEVYFNKLKNCKVVHGYLRISDINISNPFEFDVQEITGYLLIESVSGISSLNQLFPKLSIIRGELLHQSHSLLITNNDDLVNIGLMQLSHILNGNVRIENNKLLCFVNTVNWKLIGSAATIVDNIVRCDFVIIF
jgi:hypothetical protein